MNANHVFVQQILFYIQATNNEVKCKINTMKTKMRAGDYERTLNYKWP